MRWSSALLGLALATTGCNLSSLGGDCPETRWSEIEGDLRDSSGTLLGSVSVQLAERRHTNVQPRVLRAAFGGPAYGTPGPLAGHVQEARLVTASGAVVRNFAFQPGNEHQFILVPTEEVHDPAAFSALWQRFLAEELYVDLVTDLPDHPQLRRPLPRKSASPWGGSACST